jgi:hypothetical protein
MLCAEALVFVQRVGLLRKRYNPHVDRYLD